MLHQRFARITLLKTLNLDYTDSAIVIKKQWQKLMSFTITYLNPSQSPVLFLIHQSSCFGAVTVEDVTYTLHTLLYGP